LDPSGFGEQFGKVLATVGDMRRLPMLHEFLAAGPFFDEGESGGMIQIEEEIVPDAAWFEPSGSDKAFEDSAQFGFATWFGVQMGNDIDFHGSTFFPGSAFAD
jgi:hypothetical protein